MKIYKYRGWARRKAAKNSWWRVEEVRGGFIARPMTPEEKRWRKMEIEIEKVEMEVFASQIPAILNSGSSLYRLLRKSA